MWSWSRINFVWCHFWLIIWCRDHIIYLFVFCFGGQVDFYINHHLFWGMCCIFSEPSLIMNHLSLSLSFLSALVFFFLLMISISMCSLDHCSPFVAVTNIIRKLEVTELIMQRWIQSKVLVYLLQIAKIPKCQTHPKSQAPIHNVMYVNLQASGVMSFK